MDLALPDLTLPAGFLYQSDVVTASEEAQLVSHVRAFAFAEVEMRGRVARRRTAHFGWVYGYASWRIAPGPPIPEVLLPLRARAAALAGVAPEALVEVLVTEYPPGAGIGWHRDAPQFGPVVGVSLLGSCRLRFRRGPGAARHPRGAVLEPRSAYVLAGQARWQWQHSIPPQTALRYSITFRTLRTRSDRAAAAPSQGRCTMAPGPAESSGQDGRRPQ
ncbi:MAG TPA: alpha-ketoglutarate-dependent dioxygenase AlkB [Methylomirabilota bacterium]